MLQALLLVSLFCAIHGPVAETPAVDLTPAQVSALVLANPQDPYYPLAEEIAQHEQIPLVHSLEDALKWRPVYLLWVVSPAYLSDRVLADSGLALRDQPSAPSIGIISGSRVADARALWLRRSEVRGERIFAANAANPHGHIEAEILAFDGADGTPRPLTLVNLVQALESADYLTFTGHGGASYLRLDEEVKLQSADIPALPTAVIATGSCNTFRLWEDESIALAFADRGAAAYAGFAFSPNAGYLIGAYRGVPFRYTWPDFPIGHAVQVQNHGAMQGFAHFPFYWLLGDPRVSLQEQAPYRLVEDAISGSWRTLSFVGAPAGVVPVRIPDGARYHFLEIAGVGASWDRDPFYNARLQMANVQDDKVVLFEHRGGDFSVRLRLQPTWYWVAADVLTDALDNTLLFTQEGGGDILFTILGVLALVPVVVLLMRKKASPRTLVPAVLTGLAFAALHGLYALARLDRLTITSKTVVFHPLGLAGTFLLAGCGAFLFLSARSWRGRVVAVAVAALGPLVLALFYSGLLTVANNLVLRAELSTGLWNLAPSAQALIALAFEGMLFGLVFLMLSRSTKPAKKESSVR